MFLSGGVSAFTADKSSGHIQETSLSPHPARRHQTGPRMGPRRDPESRGSTPCCAASLVCPAETDGGAIPPGADAFRLWQPYSERKRGLVSQGARLGVRWRDMLGRAWQLCHSRHISSPRRKQSRSVNPMSATISCGDGGSVGCRPRLRSDRPEKKVTIDFESRGVEEVQPAMSEEER